jgi:hypothetical protein
MRPHYPWIAASCILALFGMLPVFSSSTPPAGREKVIYSFQGGTAGASPMSDLILDSAGNLYGTTELGGGTGNGTVFELKRTQDGWKERVLYSFMGGADSGEPQAGVTFDKSGNLYGTTQGTVFKLTPNSGGGWTESVIYTFNCSSGTAGCNPQGNLVFDVNGNLYGTTSSGAGGNCGKYNNGCGAVFELIPHTNGSWTEATIHSFAGAPNDGAVPVAGLVLDSAGNFYGTTQYGGGGSCGRYSTIPPGCGTSYKLTFSGDTWTETVLYSTVRGGGFGIYPSGELFVDNASHLMGVTLEGGDGIGTVFELNYRENKGWQQTQLHIFHWNPDGGFPSGRLIPDTKGDLFGVTSKGGAKQSSEGTVFELEHSHSGWKENILHIFTGAPDGANPSTGLVSDSQGHLYGATKNGGSGAGCGQGCGTVYEVTP